MNKYEVKAGLAEIGAFTVCGVSVVTCRATASEDINALWEDLFREKIGQRLPARADDSIFAVYSDYEGDHTQPYRVTIGYRLPASGDCPADLHSVTVQSGDYAVLSAAGIQPQALIEAWNAVWSSDLERGFRTDFELYGPRFFEAGVHEVLLHIGLRPAAQTDS